MTKNAVYLLVGKEEFLKKEFLQELRKKTFPADASLGLNFKEFDVERDALSAVLDFIRTAPFLGEKRLAVLWGVEELEKEERPVLLEALEVLPSTAVLVLAAGEGSPKKDNFLKAISEKASLVSCHPPFENDWPSWLQARAKKIGLEVQKDAVPVLLERAGRETSEIVSALEQLAIFINPRKTIEAKDVEALLGRSLQADVFHLVDHILAKDTGSALRTMTLLQKDGTHAVEIVAVLAGQFERLKRVKNLVERGRSANEIAELVKVHPFFLEKLMRQAQNARKTRPEAVLKSFLKCDESIKTGRADESTALLRAVAEACL